MRLITQDRKFGVCVTIAFQYLHQLSFDMRKAVLAIPNIACFRINGEDAAVFKLQYQVKPEPGKLRFEQIYEPEIIRSTKEVVTWEPPEIEQTYNQVDEELSELQAEFREFELIKSLGLAVL